MEVVAVISSCIVIYTYILYPFILFFISKSICNQGFDELFYAPFISIVVPVHNGEKLIHNKLNNLLAMHYPQHKLELIFVSDDSNDNTNEILRSLPGIDYLILEKRVGKETAIKEGIKRGSSDIVCLTDISVLMNLDGLKNMARHFSRKNVGAVSSADKTDFARHSLEAFHIWLENLIRQAEAALASSVGVSGSFFMARKHLLENIPVDCCSDLAIAFECEKNGFKAIVEPHAHGLYKKSASIKIELNRKIRTMMQGMKTVSSYSSLLNASQHCLFSWLVISHKILRWISPIALLVSVILFFAFLAPILSLEFHIFKVMLVAIIILLPFSRKILLSNLTLFSIYNLAFIISIYNVVKDKDIKIWDPTLRD